MTNTTIRLAERPRGEPTAANWRIATEPRPVPAAGEALVRIVYLSVDPAMRGWMNAGRSYIRPVEEGEVMRALGVGQVVESRGDSLRAGDFVSGTLGWQEYAVLPEGQVTKVDPDSAPLLAFLGPLGLTGLTAYFGLLDVGRPEPGETVLVSGAAGAVGSIVGQIAALRGGRPVGIAGGPEKCALLTDAFGYAGSIDYKAVPKLGDAIKNACPNGVDIFFDNVGGETLDAALARINRKARVVICGAISQYNTDSPWRGPRNYSALLINRARMEGFIVFDYRERYGEALAELSQWLRTDQLKYRTHVVPGLENAPAALLMLFRGENQGKLVVQVGEEHES